MLVILGQLDKPSRIFDYLYLGTEWNASNWEELRQNKYGLSLLPMDTHEQVKDALALDTSVAEQKCDGADF